MTSPTRFCDALLSCLACLFIGGCAAVKDAIDGADSGPSTISLEVEAPDDGLKDLLRTHLDLARLPRLTGGTPLPEEELARLVAAAPEQVRSLVRTEGYFNADVAVERLPGDPPRVRIAVEPGPRAHVQDLRIDLRGPLADAARRGEAHAVQAEKSWRQGWPLPPGAVFRNPVWSDAKVSALARLRAHAYLDAEWLSTAAVVDIATQEVKLELSADSGPLYRTGELRIEGLKYHDEKTVRRLADFGPGTPATEKLLLDYQDRLQSVGLFDGATVMVEPDAAQPEAAPVQVRVTERRLQDLTLGLGFNADVGLRGTLDHVHRRVFGRALIARNRVELGGVRQAWEGELSSHPLPGLYRNLVGGATERIESDSDVVTSARFRVGRAQDTPRIDRLVFAEVERSLVRTSSTREQADAIALHYQGVWRDVDNLLLPTRGHILGLQIGAGHARSDPGGRGPFVRTYARFNGYRPLGRSWHGQARLELGQVFVADGVAVPERLRFRAGGSESVRGYAYRSLAPIVDGQLASGKVLFTSSLELARPLLARLPQLWGAVFIDAGRAADRWRDIDPALGAGVGLRYRSPIGPLSLDVAWGEEVRKARLHLSVGVTF